MVSEKSLKNLKPNTDRTPKQREELARKAGIKSGIARKEKANFKRVLNDILEQKATFNLKKALNEAGIENTENLNILEGLINLAIFKSYDEKTTLAQLIRFLEFIRNTTDGTPIQMQINTTQAPENIEITQNIIDKVAEKIKEI